MDVPATVEDTRAVLERSARGRGRRGRARPRLRQDGPQQAGAGLPHRHGGLHGRLCGARSRHRSRAGGVHGRVAPRAAASRHPVQRRRLDQHLRRTSLGVARLRDGRRGSRGLPTSCGRPRQRRSRSVRRPARDVPGSDRALDSVQVDDRGLEGVRWYAVWDTDDRMATGKDSRGFRRRDEIFELRASKSAARVTGEGRGGSAVLEGIERCWMVDIAQEGLPISRSRPRCRTRPVTRSCRSIG